MGVRIVPRPNPEKKVRMATKKATIDIKTISIYVYVPGISSLIEYFIFEALAKVNKNRILNLLLRMKTKIVNE